MAYMDGLARRFKNYIPKSISCFRDRYTLEMFKNDLLAGLTVGVIALPFAIATAIGANVPPERGLFTAIVGGFLISALGGSRVQVGGPTSTFIVVLYGIMIRHGFESMLLATFMAGMILIIFGLAGLGTYIKYIPYPVVTGFTTGIAVVIFSSQVKDLLGLSMGSVPIVFLDKWEAYFQHLSTWNPRAVIIAGATLAIIFYFRRFKPKIPGALVALASAAFFVWLFDIPVETIGSRYGNLPRTLPHPALPHLNFEQMLVLIPDALTIALLAGIESLLAAVVSEGMTGWRHQSNCELVAQGMANIGSSIFGGMPAAGSLTRTTANVKSGACTPVAGITHACVIFLIMYLLAPLASRIPLASLAAVLLLLAWNMSGVQHFVHLLTAPRKDIIILLTVFLLTVLVNITAALQIGMILAAFLFMKQMSDVSDVISSAEIINDTRSDPDSIHHEEIPPGVEVFEINGPLFFGVADRLKNLLNNFQKAPKIFILRMRKVPTIDASGMHALEEFYVECQKQGIILMLSGVKKSPLKDLHRFHFDEMIGPDHIFSHLTSALEFSRELLRVEKFKKAMRID